MLFECVFTMWVRSVLMLNPAIGEPWDSVEDRLETLNCYPFQTHAIM